MVKSNERHNGLLSGVAAGGVKAAIARATHDTLAALRVLTGGDKYNAVCKPAGNGGLLCEGDSAGHWALPGP